MEQERSLRASERARERARERGSEAEETVRQYEASGTGSQSGGWSDANRGWSSAAVARDRFPVLTTMATIFRIIGWLAVAGGAVLLFLQVFPWIACITGTGRPAQSPMGMMSGPSCGTAILILAPMVGALVIGFGLVTFGEVIGVFRGIEGNTHQLLSRIDQAGLRDKLTGGA